MSEPSTPVLVRDLADETSGWLQAEARSLRAEFELRLDRTQRTAAWVAVGLLLGLAGLQVLLVAFLYWVAIDLGLGLAVTCLIVGAALVGAGGITVLVGVRQ